MIIGAIGASSLSWICNHSLAWMILHGIFGWLYLLYKIPWYVMHNF